jgi:2-phosphosulfolactate phosphatase
MKVEVFFTGGQVEPAAVQQKTVVVIDVLRATTTVVEALASGARAIYPASGTEEAIKLANSLGREDALLCGERQGRRIEGYDLGNSPAEYTPDRVEGKNVVLNTTNGTQTLLSAAGASRVVTAAFVNLEAATRAVVGAEELVLLCAGRAGLFSFEDAVCAGMMVRRLDALDRQAGRDVSRRLDDGARAVRTLAESVSVDASFLGTTAAGRALIEIGMEGDLEVCAEVDRHTVVPEMEDRIVRSRRARGRSD